MPLCLIIDYMICEVFLCPTAQLVVTTEEDEGEVVKIIVGLLLGSWCKAQDPWRPPLFFLTIKGLLLGSRRAAQEPWRPPDERASYYSYDDDESKSLVGMLVLK